MLLSAMIAKRGDGGVYIHTDTLAKSCYCKAARPILIHQSQEILPLVPQGTSQNSSGDCSISKVRQQMSKSKSTLLSSLTLLRSLRKIISWDIRTKPPNKLWDKQIGVYSSLTAFQYLPRVSVTCFKILGMFA